MNSHVEVHLIRRAHDNLSSINYVLRKEASVLVTYFIGKVRLTHDFRLRRKLLRATGESIKGAVHEKCIEANLSTKRLSGIFHAQPVVVFRSDVGHTRRMVSRLVAPVQKSLSLDERSRPCPNPSHSSAQERAAIDTRVVERFSQQ